ncbi:TPA: hypothetical protein ACX6Q6_003011 [Photobacterium damselae]
MFNYIPQLGVAISLLALTISGLTAWFTIFHKGKLKATKPSQVQFIFTKTKRPQILIRTLLYSTGQKGYVIESMYVRLSVNETKYSLPVWVHGTNSNLIRGSGLMIPKSGVVLDHYFMPIQDGSTFPIVQGEYKLNLLARTIYGKEIELNSITLYVNAGLDGDLCFDWGADNQKYYSHCK